MNVRRLNYLLDYARTLISTGNVRLVEKRFNKTCNAIEEEIKLEKKKK